MPLAGILCPHTLELGFPDLTRKHSFLSRPRASQASSLKPLPLTTTTWRVCTRASDDATSASATAPATTSSKASLRGLTWRSLTGDEFLWHEFQPQRAAGANHGGLHAGADQLGHHHALKVADVGHALAVELYKQVLGAQPGAIGGAVLHHFDHLHAAAAAPLGGGLGRERPHAAGDAEVGAAHSALAHQRADDLARGGVDRHRQGAGPPRPRRGHPDHATPAVPPRPARG